MDNNIVLGLIEKVKINGIDVNAKIDTGADISSICKSLIEKLKISPTGNKKIIKSSNGVEKRDLYLVDLEIKGRKFTSEFTAAKREHLNFSVLIGNDILKRGFIINPSK